MTWNTLQFIVERCSPPPPPQFFFFLLGLKTKSVRAFHIPCPDVLVSKRGDDCSCSVCSERAVEASWLPATAAGLSVPSKVHPGQPWVAQVALSVSTRWVPRQPEVHGDTLSHFFFNASETVTFASVPRLEFQTPTTSRSWYQTHPIGHPESGLHSDEMHIFSGGTADSMVLALAFFSLCRHVALRITLELKDRLILVISSGDWTLEWVMTPSRVVHTSLSSWLQSGSYQEYPSALEERWKNTVIFFFF